jgi:uncharacterized membrane protein/Mg-chelatase subunit ChlD
VFVVDLSASNAASRTTMASFVDGALAHRPGEDVAGVVDVGRNALVEQPVATLSSFDSFQSSVDPNYTNLQSGLELASAMFPAGYRKRVVLLTDGRQNTGDALFAARLLRSQNIRLDVVPAQSAGGPDVAIDSVTAPPSVHTHERFSVTVTVRSTVSTIAQLNVLGDHALILSKAVRLRAGSNRFSFQHEPLTPGFHILQAHITAPADREPRNDSGSAFVSVQGAPHVLVIAAVPSEASDVLASLRSTGIAADFQQPQQVSPQLSALERYAAIVIVDTAAAAFDPAFLDQLVPYVRDLGHGLVVIGGQDAYGVGGYGGTPLEQVLPVRMDLPNRKELPTAAVALIIESLEEPLPINISKVAGKGVVRLLTERDQVAVDDTPEGTAPGWVVLMQNPTNKAAIYHAIDAMEPGDPITYAPYLQNAYQVLKASHAKVKHIILLGDGDAVSHKYERVVKAIRAGGVTVSTVVTNALSPDEYKTMKEIARWGGGRYYQADDASAVPKIFVREARTVAGSGIIEGSFFPLKVADSPMLRDLHAIPPLDGYVAAAAKPTGQILLVSKKLDPILTGWQFGLGRSVAWTSDAAGLWTKDWLLAPGANRFWANLVSWILPASTSGQLYVATSASAGQGQISVDIPGSLGASPTVTASILGPGSSGHGPYRVSSVRLQPSAPGRYQAAFDAAGAGAYFISVEARGARHAAVGQAGLAVPYPAEYRVAGTNSRFLHALTAAGGGSVIAGPSTVWENNLPAVFDQRALTDLLWLLAILLLPIDIGIRRLVVTRRDLARLWAAFSGLMHPSYPADMEAPIPPIPRPAAGRANRDGATVPTGTAPTTPARALATTGAPTAEPVRPPSHRLVPASSPSRETVAASATAGNSAVAGRADRDGATVSTGTASTTASRLLEAKRRRQQEG